MKKSLKISGIFLCLILLFIWSYFYTNIFYEKTSISINEKKSEVRISKLTNKQELDEIKEKFEKIGVSFIVKDVSYSGGTLSTIDVQLKTPGGASAEYKSESLRITRSFDIVILNDDKKGFQLRIG